MYNPLSSATLLGLSFGLSARSRVSVSGMCGPFPDVVFAKARKRPATMCGTPEKRRDAPARTKGQFPWISADLINFLRCSEKHKWFPEEASHLHGLATDSTCSWCVSQFRHLGKLGRA